MKRLKYILISFLLYSCGENATFQSPLPEVGIDVNLETSQLSGVWTGCKAFLGDSFFTTITISNSVVTSIIDTFSGNTTCSGPSFFRSIKLGVMSVNLNKVSVSGYSGGSVDAFPIDITIKEFEMLPLAAGVAAGLNANMVCGETDWADGTIKNVMGLTTCDPGSAGNEPDEILNGSVTNIMYIDTSLSPHRLYTNILISSNGSFTTRPTSLSSINPYNVELIKN